MMQNHGIAHGCSLRAVDFWDRSSECHECVALLEDRLLVLHALARVDVAEIECMELPLSPTFLSDRIPCLDQTISARLFDLFKEKGFVNQKGYMKQDGCPTHWKDALRDTKD
ncbi:serine/threonine-protein kinase TNNI3K-like [Hibiscus syriacus]|uniref:Serine/threonine-protein kinase TNNI3K-like n=1 Tax=Hibiscus syriacus TaxID=106335 RepID=A0A6A3CLX8_HIBSY|nr:serine/threonine-protein kinase TNNI3K-like [Hibiscus syriacus]